MEIDLDLKAHKKGEVLVLDLSGDIDSYTCSKLREALMESIENGDFHVVIGMDNVNYIDSLGLGTLVGGLRRVTEQDGGLAISGAKPHLIKVLNITGLNKVFQLFDNEADAVQSLRTLKSSEENGQIN